MYALAPSNLLAIALFGCSAAVAHKHGHHDLHEKRHGGGHEYDLAPRAIALSTGVSNTTCGCTTYTTTFYGEAALHTPSHNTTITVQVSPVAATGASSSSSVAWSSSNSQSSSSSTPSSTSVPLSAAPASSSSWSAPNAPAWFANTWSSSGSAAAPYSPSPSAAAATSTYQAPSSPASSWSGAQSSVSSGSSGSISPNGNQWAMTYTPYNNDSSCKTADEVASDVAVIASKGFTTIRMYATDCSGPQNIGAAAKAHGLRLIVGIFIDDSGIGSNTDEQVSTLTSWGQGQWDLVEMVVFGNEAIFNGYVSASALATGISNARSAFRSAGYNGPVTTCDTMNEMQSNAQTLCPVIDVITANIHPFFNGQVTSSGAGQFVAQQLTELAGYCNNAMPAYNLETGWPSAGDANGAAVPSPQDQKTAIQSIMSAAGSKCAIFSFADDLWKAPGDLGVEQYWGCADLFSG